MERDNNNPDGLPEQRPKPKLEDLSPEVRAALRNISCEIRNGVVLEKAKESAQSAPLAVKNDQPTLAAHMKMLRDISVTQRIGLLVAIVFLAIMAWTNTYITQTVGGEYPRTIRTNRWTGEVCFVFPNGTMKCAS